MNKPETDRKLSSAADEFVWDTDEHTEIHRFVLAPLSDLLAECGANRILDLGCGNGSLTARFAELGYEMTGVDHSLSGIGIAKGKNDKLEFAQHDITTDLPDTFHNSFDAVISVEVIEHLLLPRRLMENAACALKPGGLFILTTPYHGYLKNLAIALTGKFDEHWHPLRDYGHIKFFSQKTIEALFDETGFSRRGFQRVGRIPPLARSMIVWGRTPS